MSKLLMRWAAFAVVIGVALQATAQKEGNNAIASDNKGTVAPSTAYIDASPFYYGSSSDICGIIFNILNCSSANGCSGGYSQYPTSGAVIDARGILPVQVGQSLTCSSNPFPTTSHLTTVLLPGQTIKISHMWILPSNTRIIGEGSGQQNYTAIGAAAGFSDTALIQMGPSSGSATGVVIQHLKLDGQSLGAFDGIDNVSAGDGSYVEDVDIRGIGATATNPSSPGSPCTATGGSVTSLCISPNATYSGPYSTFNINPSTACSGITCTNTACVKIQAQTRGLHNLTCVAGSNSSSSPLAAIYLDAYNNTIENIHVEGFQDAIVVGDYADGLPSPAPQIAGNTITTVTASYGGGPAKNAVHICKQNTASGACSSSSLPVHDLTVLQAETYNGGGSNLVTAIQDDNLTQSVNSVTGQGFVGLYAVGSTSSTGGYARFTTNPGNSVATPTWGTGSSIPIGTSCSNSGALYSNSNGTSGGFNTIYVCSVKNGSLQWVGIGN